jgi:hypothetical protein
MEYLSTEIKSAREAMTIFKILGIKDVTTDRQRKNGTTVYELPISQVWQTLQPKPLRFATYTTGYVRNVTEGLASSYQINKTKKVSTRTSGYAYDTVERILIHSWEERLIYLAKFIIKNYYQKTTYIMSEYVMDCLREAYVRDYNNQPSNRLPFGDIVHPDSSPADDIKVIINGHRYNLS